MQPPIRILTFVVMLSVIACVAPVGEEPDGGGGAVALYRSGSRLKARVGRTADGARHFMGWYDSELRANCAFGLAGDNRERCLPADLVDAPIVYQDPECSRRMLVTTTCLLGAYSLHGRTFGCSQLNDVRKIGTAVSTATFYSNTDAGCTMGSSVGGEVYRELSEPLDPKDFVERFESIE